MFDGHKKLLAEMLKLRKQVDIDLRSYESYLQTVTTGYKVIDASLSKIEQRLTALEAKLQ